MVSPYKGIITIRTLLIMKEILNFYQITSLVATSGQPTKDQFHLIAKLDYDVVVNLGMHDSDNVLVDEGNIVTSLGMSYVHIPVPFESPLPTHLHDFFNAMTAFDGKKIFVHCVVNARVSAFMYQYLTLKKGLDTDTATSPLLEKWLPSMDENWKAIIGLSIEEIEL